TGQDTSVALLGMPEEEDWIFLAMWNDKSFVRNTLMYDLARKAGQWAPNTRHVEVLLNGQYAGIYVFCEKIKRDGDRVDVAKLTPDDNELPNLSGGYIFRHDYGWDFATDNWRPQNCPDRLLNFEFDYPKAEEITQPQIDYLTGYMDDMEEALFSPNFRDPQAGYRAFLDMDSWVDYFLLSELSGNVDAYKKSMYYHKDRDGLLKLGPIWDFDWALKFLGENSFPNGSGWLYTIDPCTQDVLYVPYFKRLMEDSFFQQLVCARWQTLRASHLANDLIFSYIDSVALVVDEAKDRHFERWECLGYDSGAPELPPYPTTYAGEVEKLKNFLQLRLTWLDKHLQTVACGTNTVEPDTELSVELLPNISDGEFVVRAKGIRTGSGKLAAKIYDARGVFLWKTFLANGDNSLDLTSLTAGVYFLIVETKQEKLIRKMVLTH
ncbi:MAG: CotH kinase family protein, partial [Saprospiraceae bacterium]|nr:CotH kinase family protein [Saprospiraceae bacterium]